MRPVGLPEVPAQTVMVARAASPKGSLAIRVRDRLAEVFADEPFAEAFGVRGAPGLSPGVLSLVTVLQFAEDLTDRQAAAMAVRAIDWKYALGMELTDIGFDASVCCAGSGHGSRTTAWNGWSSTGSLSTARTPVWWRPGASSVRIPPM
ncbi:transposase [Streptomyces europaeiscabiei]|uniref:transposase n=1 Tax=Streptomyces europaeiscabiei TaxID=146819 RepID=UPI0029AD051A|nr:transposase [Streptomyces europaeiscabiei]MDX3698090.1 transposase [Streptomyces europaeiscabiei]